VNIANPYCGLSTDIASLVAWWVDRLLWLWKGGGSNYSRVKSKS